MSRFTPTIDGGRHQSLIRDVIVRLALVYTHSNFFLRARLVDYLFPMSKVLKIRVGRSGKKKNGKKKKKAEVPIIGYQISFFVTEMLPMPWQEVQICVHDVHETHFPLYYSSACSYRKLCRFEKC